MEAAVASTNPPDKPLQRPSLRQPNEILIMVFRECPDFCTLWGLINVSAVARNMFLANANDIFKRVLGNSGVPYCTSYLMHVVAHTRLGSYASAASPFGAPLIVGQMRISLIPPPTLITSEGIFDTRLLLKLVGLAYRIHGLAHACLDRHLGRFNTVVAAIPDHLRAPHTRDPAAGATALLPLSWYEEQAVIRAFWLVQLFLEFTEGVRAGRLPSPHQLYKPVNLLNFLGPYERQLLMAVTEYIEETTNARAGETDRVETEGLTPSGRLCAQQLPNLSRWENLALMAPSPFSYQNSPQAAGTQLTSEASATIRLPDAQRAAASFGWSNTPRFPVFGVPRSSEPPRAWEFGQRMVSNILRKRRCNQQDNTLSQHLQQRSMRWGSKPRASQRDYDGFWAPYRPRGFVIWDDDRMISAGFYPAVGEVAVNENWETQFPNAWSFVETL